MGQTGWRLPDDLLKRVRVHCAQTGERQNEFVRQALEDALGDRPSAGHPAKSREVAGSTPAAPAPLPTLPVKDKPLGKGFVPPRPKGT